ncbi:uncharacterized protein Dere_GG11915 [Drosophila erecta]|nr:uncharacterized protein Dere_GG11915 [Drosophila erecta]
MGGHNCRSLVTRPSYTIRHQYPGPLVTYDGEARCEPRFIRISDLNCSTMELIFQAYGDDEDEMAGIFEENIEMGENCGKSKKNFGCQASLPTEDDCIDSALNCRLNGGKEESGFEDYSATRKQLRALEDQARGIYETYVESFPNSPSWDILKPAQKLRFQWKALTGDDLMETPYENFTLSFSRGFLETFPFASGTTVQNEQRIAWCNLDRCQRMPFILQALLYQVASGAIDPEDHCAVREHFHKLR